MDTLICRHGPYTDSLGQQALDLALIHAAFDQPLRILFQAEGVHLLRLQQNAEPVLQKTFTSGFGLLSLYDSDQLWVISEDLEHYGLQPEQLLVSVKLLPKAQLAAFLAESRHLYCL